MITEADERIAKIDARILDVINLARPAEAIGEILERLSVTPEEMALVITIASRRWPGPPYQHIRTMLEAHLSVLLTRAHVRAQERMSNAADWLSGAAIAFSVVQIVLAYVAWRGL